MAVEEGDPYAGFSAQVVSELHEDKFKDFSASIVGYSGIIPACAPCEENLLISKNDIILKVKEMVKETEKQENTIIGGSNAGQINNSKSIKENNAFIGGWQFQRNWCTIIETFTRSLAPGKIHGNIEKENDDEACCNCRSKN